MFTLSSGSIVKDYLEGTGRTEFTINGDVSVSPISLSMKVSVLATVTVDSTEYNLPIPGHFTVKATSGNVSIDQDIVLFPGSELHVGKGVTCTLAEGRRVIVFDYDEWVWNEDGTNGYVGQHLQKYYQLAYAPGGLGVEGRERDAVVVIDGVINASKGAVYTTLGGADMSGSGQVITKTGSETFTYMMHQEYGAANIRDWVTIDIYPVKIKNLSHCL